LAFPERIGGRVHSRAGFGRYSGPTSRRFEEIEEIRMAEATGAEAAPLDDDNAFEARES
jgi:hypothetical protein